jgi:hypothetical protein
MLKRSTAGIVIGIAAGVATFLFLAGLAESSSITWFGRLLWPSLVLLCISVIAFNRVSEKIIESDQAYQIYRGNRYDLVDRMGFGQLRYIKIGLIAITWISWICFGVFAACVAAKIILLGR